MSDSEDFPIGWPSENWIERATADPRDKIIWLQLLKIADIVGKSKNAAAQTLCALHSAVQSHKLKIAPRREGRNRFINGTPDASAITAQLSRPHKSVMRDWYDKHLANPFPSDSEFLAVLVKIESERIVKRRSKELAIKAANGATRDSLNEFERVAYDIVIGEKRARTPENRNSNGGRPPSTAHKIVERIRREWTKKRRAHGIPVEGHLTATAPVRVVLPIIDALAEAPGPIQEMTSKDRLAINRSSVGILEELGKIYGAQTDGPRELARLVRASEIVHPRANI